MLLSSEYPSDMQYNSKPQVKKTSNIRFPVLASSTRDQKKKSNQGFSKKKGIKTPKREGKKKKTP
jgi:hypothetical protein